MAEFRDYHRTVVGFHGTSRKVAERIVLGGEFNPSRNSDDWLGNGIYFWEYGPQRALDWARNRYSSKTRIAVLGAMIRLGNCLDLLDPQNLNGVQEVEKDLRRTMGPGAPRNHNAHKYLDCAVFEAFYKMQDNQDVFVDTARAVYVPTSSAKRAWERSWIYEEAHVQLCVRNPKNILGAWLVTPEA